nr:PREDICTED: dynein heavy chain domain-containing protein 1-like [Apteryx mantelli mantelli]
MRARKAICSQPVKRGGAQTLRQRLEAQLQESGRPDPLLLDALVAEVIVVFRRVLKTGSRRSWLHLLYVLQLLRPFQEQLGGHKELLPLLKSLCQQYHNSQAFVSDLDILGAIGKVFPKAHLMLDVGVRESEPSARLLLSGSGPVFAEHPGPSVLERETKDQAITSSLHPVSSQELQRPLSDTGKKATGSVLQGLEEDDASSQPPLTGLQACETFMRNRDLGKIDCAFLNVAPSRHFRPYDLVVVPRHKAEPQHYVFSSFGVLHVHPEDGAKTMTLAEWHREVMLWQLLCCFLFFQHCLEHKVFTSWWKNVKRCQLQKRRKALNSRLLLAVSHFAAALLHISRLLQELRSVHWLPQDDSTCYTFPGLQLKLVQENSHAQSLLRRFFALCSSILELVRNDTYKMVHGLQTQVQGCRLYVSKESLYKQRVRYECLQNRLQQAESWLQRLGMLAKLTNFLICQNLVSIVQEEITAFVSNVLQCFFAF